MEVCLNEPYKYYLSILAISAVFKSQITMSDEYLVNPIRIFNIKDTSILCIPYSGLFIILFCQIYWNSSCFFSVKKNTLYTWTQCYYGMC